VRTAGTPAAAVLAVAGSLLVGCTTGSPATGTGSATPASSSTAPTTSGSAPGGTRTPPGSVSSRPPATSSAGGGQIPAPTAGEVARVVVRRPGDATTVTADVPSSRNGYVVEAGCVGDPGTHVTWLVTPAIGPAGEPATGTVVCDGAGHAVPAVPAGPVPVRVVLRVDVDRSAVREAFAVLRAAG
jgi:hypothetical protein